MTARMCVIERYAAVSDKEKGLQWLSSAKSNSQAIAAETLNDVANIVKNSENPQFDGENVRYRVKIRRGMQTKRKALPGSPQRHLIISRK